MFDFSCLRQRHRQQPNHHQFSLFSGWSGTCTGTADCSFTMSDTTGVTATFTINSVQSVLLGTT
ncbi:MAG TPA: hypothetical protein VIU40_09835 [Geobacteraceae bacterium]